MSRNFSPHASGGFARQRWPILAAFLAGAALVVLVHEPARKIVKGISRPRVEIVRNGAPSTANWSLTTEHWTERSLHTLIEAEGLDKLAPADAGFLDLVGALVPWTSRQWETGVPDPYPRCNALDILRDIRDGTTSGFCGQYSYVLADVLKARGVFAVRYAELRTRELAAHFAVEAWSDDHQKWVLLDPWFNLYYTDRAATPLSALELHDLAVGGQYDAAIVVQLEPKPRSPRLEDHAGGAVPYYYHYAASTRSDYMRHPQPVTVAEREATFVYFDDARVDSAQRLDGYLLRSDRLCDFAYPMNQVYVTVASCDRADGVVLGLSTRRTTPSFKGFECRINGGSWQDLTESRVVIPPNAGHAVVEVRTRNAYGRAGEASVVEIRF